MLLIGLAGYFARLDDLPVVGEEGRRARSAIRMIETGDWVVVRNQGVVFPDRPPMTNWLMAAAGLARGGVDVLAIRLPSALAVLLMALVLYAYCRRLGSRLEALAAPAVFLTLGQVLQLGRLGESEAVFVLFLGSALLLWHLGFARGASPTLTWCAGYALAALAALTKGLQAPVYFVGTTAAFLAWRRDWRWLLGRGQWIGAGLFAAIVLAWQVPYYRATDWPSVAATWLDVVGPRLGPNDLATHLVEYPVEVLAALLPWAPVLGLLASPAVRRRLAPVDATAGASRPAFLLAALCVTFPTVWLSSGAKSRYYMPLYPLVAVAIAMILAQCSAAPETSRLGSIRRRLHRVLGSFVLGLLAVALIGLGLDASSPLGIHPAAGWIAAVVLAGVAAAAAAFVAARAPGTGPGAAAVLTAALFFALLHSGWFITQQVDRRNDPRPGVEALHARVPHPETMVSFGPVHTNFLYFWGDFVPEIPWPRTADELPPDVDYFAFDRRPTDTAESRLATRGMVQWTTPGTLPFAWEEIGAVDPHRVVLDPPAIEVVVGRVLRDAEGRPRPAR